MIARICMFSACLLLATQAVAQQNVVIVLDDSGSMDQSLRNDPRTRKIDAAKTALRTVLQQLPEDVRVGIVSLNGADWLLPLSQVDRSDINSVLSRIRAEGGTPLGKFMKVAADTLLEARAKQQYGTYKLLIVTDGEANDQQLVDFYLPDIIARGLVVDVIGVDMSGNHSLSTKVQTYRRADDPESLTQAISEVVLGEMSGDSGDASEADFEFLEGLPPEVATAALAALSRKANEPIGQRQVFVPEGTQVAQASPSAAPQHQAPAADRTVTVPAPSGQTTGRPTILFILSGFCCFAFALIVVAGIGIVLVVKK